MRANVADAQSTRRRIHPIRFLVFFRLAHIPPPTEQVSPQRTPSKLPTALSYMPKNTAPPRLIHIVRGTTPAKSALGPSLRAISDSRAGMERKEEPKREEVDDWPLVCKEGKVRGSKGGQPSPFLRVERNVERRGTHLEHDPSFDHIERRR
jgi:hypothetical protein